MQFAGDYLLGDIAHLHTLRHCHALNERERFRFRHLMLVDQHTFSAINQFADLKLCA